MALIALRTSRLALLNLSARLGVNDMNSTHTDMLDALLAVFNDMRNGMPSPSLLTMQKVYSAIQQACEHDWRGVDWGRMCFKCGKEDRQI